MGIGPRITSSCPDPKRCHIMLAKVVNDHVIAEVYYEGVTTFEGLKLMVFPQGVLLRDVQLQSFTAGVDPHFSDDPRYIHPIARFRPDNEGWRMARMICETRRT